ncbi:MULTISPECIES: GNAT family N-acetyltransferase [unclassified Bacillus (in: firmicutes)]|uniref:GNAT family N-acetyltransferase n=1 Tax=unclassified Bacillus (in: firmicutes) TaxID=185979 RepID=UPI001BE6DAC9|nr:MULTISPECIES: GNAT family N-acetyltransferase [unclassified Bacillus (in: firmicutes)]MBT2637341.1 GNAT family N-acetyltransferase [Bacillus sp. ISL-39]MBT2660414.1 GNAT family N-acetyltransferase [Bacillus sp. ISL-45]
MFYKELYVYDGNRPLKAIIRNYTKDDFEQLISVQKEAFPPPFPEELLWNTEQLANHVDLFPEGALCVEVGGRIAGSITGLVVHLIKGDEDHSWEEITDNGYIRNHDPEGNTLYIVDICISPAYRKLGLGKWMMQSMYETVVQLDLERLLGGGRMPGYHLHSADLSIDQYVEKVLKGELKDPVVSFLLRCGRTPVKPVANYLEDEESLNYGMLMEWKNPFKA